MIPLITVSVRGNVLYLDLKDANAHNEATINYYLNIKELKAIDSYSSSTVYIPEALKTDSFSLSLNNFGDAKINVDVKKLEIKILGAGKIEAKGTALEQTLLIRGAGEFNGSQLAGEKASIGISGAGIAKADVTNNLDVNINGTGNVKYCGKPVITKTISGDGEVIPLEDKECKQ